MTLIVFLAALGTALATGLGAAPFLVARSPQRSWLGIANAIASGVMLGASASLLIEGTDRDAAVTIVGAAAGALFVAVAHRFAGHGHDFGVLHGADARRAILIVGVMTVHSFAEGVGVGSAFADGGSLGLLIAIAIAVHNIPEGLAISLVLCPRGVGVGRAAAWSVFSSLPQPLMAVPAFLFVEQFRSVLPAGLGFAAGAMVWMVVRELLPEALKQMPARKVIPVCAAALGAMVAFQVLVL